MLTVLN